MKTYVLKEMIREFPGNQSHITHDHTCNREPQCLFSIICVVSWSPFSASSVWMVAQEQLQLPGSLGRLQKKYHIPFPVDDGVCRRWCEKIALDLVDCLDHAAVSVGLL